MLTYSKTTQRSYDMDSVVFYRNMIQCAWMLSKQDCVLLDVFESNGKLVMVFPREIHKKYIQEWAERNYIPE